jgi:hypothetical protein
MLPRKGLASSKSSLESRVVREAVAFKELEPLVLVLVQKIRGLQKLSRKGNASAAPQINQSQLDDFTSSY